MDAQFFGSILHQRRSPARNEPGLEPGFVREPDAETVARVEPLGLDQPPGGAFDGLRQVIDAAVRQHAVDVHQQKLDFASALAQRSG